MVAYYPFGKKISLRSHKNSEAKSFIKALKKTDYASYIESVKWLDGNYKSHIEGVVFDIKTSAFSKSRILNTERTGVVFAEEKNPMAFCLRTDFPRNILHVNLCAKELPVSPCLYEEPPSEVRLWITPEIFIKDIHSWYRRASDKTAHLPNQALEPLILDGKTILVSSNFFNKDDIYYVSENHDINTCEPINWGRDIPSDAKILIPIEAEPAVSRCINYAPSTIKELMELTSGFGLDLRGKISDFTYGIEQRLNEKIKEGKARGGNYKKYIATEFARFTNNLSGFSGEIPDVVSRHLNEVYRGLTVTDIKKRDEVKNTIFSWIPMVWLRLPKKRSVSGEIEWIEDIAFFVSKSLGDLCLDMNIYHKIHEGDREYMIHENDMAGKPSNVLKINDEKTVIEVIKPVQNLDINMAQKLSGLKRKTKSFLAVGVGSLGSQVVTNLTRLGMGKWKLLDHDILLPHNFSRHALFAEHAGSSKAKALSGQLNRLLDDVDFSQNGHCDFLEYEKDISCYDLIFDFSASTAVVRHMAVKTERPAIMSSFMTRNGKYFICLYEGKKKSARVDDLEYLLACECVRNNKLKSVLEDPGEKEIRYSGACSDITTVLPQDSVAVHSGIMSSYIKKNIGRTKPEISIWELTEDCKVNRITISPSGFISTHVKGWDVRMSDSIMEEMRECRLKKLPNETGGVLIGGFDLHNKIVYIVEIIPSPKDSVEEPYSYIRGFEKLPEKVERVKKISGRRLNYVGEWHSHPRGVTPSSLDKKALSEQAEEMSTEGLPGIMLIIGENNKYNLLIKHK